MSTIEKNIDAINVFLIGNNPIELSNIYNKLKDIHHKTFKAEVGFELKGLFKRITRFNPACILIDDNVERQYVNQLLSRLSSNQKTRNIPITVLKNDNKDRHMLQAEEYLLKDGVTSEVLLKSILNSIRLKKMQRKAAIIYKKKKKQLASMKL